MNIRHHFRECYALSMNKTTCSLSPCTRFTTRVPHLSVFSNHISLSSSHHTYSAFPIPLSATERDRLFERSMLCLTCHWLQIDELNATFLT